MATSLITRATDEPIDLADAKLHIRQDGTADDDLIQGLIIAAREKAEDITRRALLTQTLEMRLDHWPGSDRIVLSKPPLQSVTFIKYYDDDDVEYTLSSDDYFVDTSTEPGRIVLRSGASWPSLTLRVANGVVVRYVAGWETDNDVPFSIKQAILLMIGHWYENREMIEVSGRIPKEVPFTVDALLYSHRILTEF